MNHNLYESLDFNKIKNLIGEKIISDRGQILYTNRFPSSNLNSVRFALDETAEAAYIVKSSQHVPFIAIEKISYLTDKVEKGIPLPPEELTLYADFLRSIRLIRNFFAKNESYTPILARFTSELCDYSDLEEQIYSAISGNEIRSEYSRPLKKVRDELSNIDKSIDERLKKLLQNTSISKMLQEKIVTSRNDTYAIPVKAQYKLQFPGSVIDTSGKGSTVFMEPKGIQNLVNEKHVKKGTEAEIEFQILAELMGAISESLDSIHYAIDVIAELDILFAKAKYSIEISGTKPRVNKKDYINLRSVKHPLLGEAAVPLSLELGRDFRGIIITGANAGGKTIALKTVALLTLLTMFGVLIPGGEESEVAVFDNILLDMGDNQSIENSLSTFSAHMKNVNQILAKASAHTLSLLDEIGSGTDPKEGAALGVAILDTLYHKGSLIIASTHYGEIKDYALNHPGFMTAKMDYNKETLTPYYRLIIGKTGESSALIVAKKMGLSSNVLNLAKKIVNGENIAMTLTTSLLEEKRTEKDIPIRPFGKGDRVTIADRKEPGLFHSYKDEYTAFVWFDNEEIEIPIKRVRLVMSAGELYPKDYNLDSLFEDFATRKKKRDLERGSKKAHKQLNKDSKNRVKA